MRLHLLAVACGTVEHQLPSSQRGAMLPSETVLIVVDVHSTRSPAFQEGGGRHTVLDRIQYLARKVLQCVATASRKNNSSAATNWVQNTTTHNIRWTPEGTTHGASAG